MFDDTIISVKNLTKTYKLYDSPLDRLKESIHLLGKKYHHHFKALSDVSFVVSKGETIGIIGRNGSGKSTLLKILTGVLTPTTGDVMVKGKVSALLELGAGFNPELTGIENIFFNGALMGYSRQEMEERIDEIIAFAEIGEFILQPVKSYSSGMFVRLAFAVAVNVEPEILIVDEALSVGDIMFQSKCMDKIKRMMAGGVTTLFVTHDINTVNTLCNRAILLDSGKIFSQGKPQIVTLQYYQLLREKEHVAQLAGTKEEAQAMYEELREEIREKEHSEDFRYGIGSAKITEYTLVNSKGQETILLRCGERFKLRLKVEFIDTVENPCYGFVISNIAGQNLQSVHSFIDTSQHFGPRKAGDVVEVEMKTSLLLNPGKYLLSFGIADHRTYQDFTNIDTRKNVCSIEVYGKELACGLIHHHPVINVSSL